MNLPIDYLNRMQETLGTEYEAFLAEYEKQPLKALRFNTKKVRPETIEKLVSEWQLEQVPWCSDGYYYKESETLRPGLSPYHDAGVFYIQEPSAMITAEEADIGPEDIVLDLCAAPGGKSTQAAAKCKLLVSNEPIPNRARILSSNIERMGFDNVIVTSAFPDKLAAVCKEYFTRIIVDAPCSGEGMMRKDQTAINEWSAANVSLCIERQSEILEAAATMLKPGGKLAYSTCTFEYGENDGQIKHFLSLHPEFTLLHSHTIYPHQQKGEGHFCAVLAKSSNGSSQTGNKKKEQLPPFAKKGIHVLRNGVEKGETITDKRGKTRYEPSHAEALAGVFGSSDMDSVNLKSLALAESYLKGNTIDFSTIDSDTFELHSDGGWLTVMYDGYPMGLGKLTGTLMKNHYPKGLRHL